MPRDDVRFESPHCTLLVKWPAPLVAQVVFSGMDTNGFGEAPFVELEAGLQRGTELYIDARHAKAASLAVSGAWARWLERNRDRFACVSMLTGSRFIEISAAFVKRFAQMGNGMRLYSDAVAFDGALERSIARRDR